MKRLILLPLALLTTMMSWANVIVPADFRVITKDGSVAYFSGYGTELTFNAEGTVLTITTEGTDAVVSYAVDGIEAIEFDEAGAHSDKYSYDVAHIDVTIDSSDEASYSEIEEVVVYDVFGRQQSTVNGQQLLTIDLSNLNTGIYFVKINTKEGNIVKRFIKQ